jgi:two-component system response regulator DevR
MTILVLPMSDPEGRTRLFIADDHEIVRRGLAQLLGQAPQLSVAGHADSASMVAEAGRLKPDLVLLGLHLPDASGLEACRELGFAQPQLRVMFLATCHEEDAAAATVVAGASGYATQGIALHALVEAIGRVAAGGRIIETHVTDAALSRVRAFLAPPRSRRQEDLSPQERRVLTLVVDGKTNKEIARELQISDLTVKSYLSNAFQKLQVQRRSHAAAIFRRRDRA